MKVQSSLHVKQKVLVFLIGITFLSVTSMLSNLFVPSKSALSNDAGPEPSSELKITEAACRFDENFGKCYRRCLRLPPNRTSCFKNCDSLNNFTTTPCDNLLERFIPIRVFSIARKRVISYTLFGNNPAYYAHLDRVIEHAKKNYPEWIIRFYISAGLPTNITDLMIQTGSEVILVLLNLSPNSMLDPINHHGKIWRFFVADDLGVERYIVRDIDSYIYRRERMAVDDWIRQGTLFHIMRDDISMSRTYMAGMWGGIVNTSVLSMKSIYISARDYYDRDGYDVDEDFLRKYVVDIFKSSLTCHKSRKIFQTQELNCRPFPTLWKGTGFTGNKDAIVNPNSDFI